MVGSVLGIFSNLPTVEELLEETKKPVVGVCKQILEFGRGSLFIPRLL